MEVIDGEDGAKLHVVWSSAGARYMEQASSLGYLRDLQPHMLAATDILFRPAVMELVQRCATQKLFSSTNASNAPAQRLFARAGLVPSGMVENLDPGDPEFIFFKALQNDGPQDPLAQSPGLIGWPATAAAPPQSDCIGLLRRWLALNSYAPFQRSAIPRDYPTPDF